MSLPAGNRSIRDNNRQPLLYAVSYLNPAIGVQVAADPATGALLTETVSGGATSTSINDGVTSSIKATVASLASSNPLAVEIVDGSGNQITSFGGGTQYTDGGTPPTHPVAPTLVYDNSGTWAHVSVANPLPVTATISGAGIATSANQTNKSQVTQIADGSGSIIASTSNALNVSLTNASVAVTATDLSTNIAQFGGSNVTIGQQVASASIPVILPSATITTLTPPASVTVTQGTGSNLHAVIDAGSAAIGTVGTTSAVVNVGQKTVNTTAVQITASSTVPTNGIIIRALSTNAASIFVGGSGVTTSTGYELVAGESISFSCNLNTLYIISVASTTDKICYNVE